MRNIFIKNNTIKDIIKNIFDLFLDLIYPPQCFVCNDIFLFNINNKSKKYLCSKCEFLLDDLDINKLAKNIIKCYKCNRPLNSNQDFYLNYNQNFKSGISKNKILCSLCITKKKIFFDKNYSVFVYKDLIIDLIHKFKFKNQPNIGLALSKIIYNKIAQDNSLLYKLKNQFDYIIPVPIHKKRRFHRGFNQSEILAIELSKNLSLPVKKNILLRIKNTKPQWQLNINERENNLNNAFKINKNIALDQIKNKNIILLDDIFTTGSTINKCSQILKESGANYIFSLTLSITIK